MNSQASLNLSSPTYCTSIQKRCQLNLGNFVMLIEFILCVHTLLFFIAK